MDPKKIKQDRITTHGSKAMENISEHYAKELDAQFHTLNHFAMHAGEIGRAHERFLCSILRRFLPGNIKLSSGFVASPNWTSRQQDILIHKRDFTTLFEVGDCVVIDHNAFIGAVEVKTNINSSSKFLEVINIQEELREQMRHRGLYAIYAWDAVSLEKTLEVLWQFARTSPNEKFNLMPDVIYVRGKYLLLANRDGHRESPPYHVLNIRKENTTEGQALLGLVASVWRFGLMEVRPWWLLSWHDTFGVVAGKLHEIQWPKDLQKSIMTV